MSQFLLESCEQGRLVADEVKPIIISYISVLSSSLFLHVLGFIWKPGSVVKILMARHLGGSSSMH